MRVPSYGREAGRPAPRHSRSWVGAAAHLLSLRRACLRHTPHRTVRNGFPLHGAPQLSAMNRPVTAWASLLWICEIFSLFKDIRPQHRSLTCHKSLPSFPQPTFTGFIGTTTAPPGIALLLHPQLGWSARSIRSVKTIPFPRSRSSRLHPDVGTA